VSVVALRPFAFLLLVSLMGALYEGVLSLGEVAVVEVPRDERVVLHRHDASLGWLPRTDGGLVQAGDAFETLRLNALGLRDAEPDDARPYRLLVMGGDAVWGTGTAAADRFTDRLEARSETWDVVNAGVSGHGTDQSMLLARQLVPTLDPTALVLVFDPATDRAFNQSNESPGGHYKPYFVLDDTTLVLKGQPAPQALDLRGDAAPASRFGHLFADAALRALHPLYVGADPSEALLVQFREEVGRVGVSFFVALTRPDRRAEEALDAARIPWVALDAHATPDFSGRHWTPEGHTAVAARLDEFLGEQLDNW
jgi:hypothetical protein